MRRREIQHEVQKVMSSAEIAAGYVRRMVEKETRGWGDQEGALSRLEARYGLPFWTMNNLRTGRAKTVEAGLFARIRGAYLAICESQVARLQHEISVEKALNEDDDLADLEGQARRLVEKIEAAKAKRRAVR